MLIIHKYLLQVLLGTCLLLITALAYQNADAHGGVFMEDDLCIINIDFLQAHFTVYQPLTRANEEYCEDLPDAGKSVFVLDYLHNSLKTMPVDFRIVKDLQNLGRFAKWEDIKNIPDLDAVTVFYQAPQKHASAAMTVEHTFVEEGNYIGIVTTQHPTQDKLYTAVFPFEVGSTGFGYLPLFIGLLILVQINYWLMSGGYSRFRSRANMKKEE